jgi:hypothetical protein
VAYLSCSSGVLASARDGRCLPVGGGHFFPLLRAFLPILRDWWAEQSRKIRGGKV